MYSTCGYSQFKARPLVVAVAARSIGRRLQSCGIHRVETYGKDYKVTNFHSGEYLSVVHKFALQAFFKCPMKNLARFARSVELLRNEDLEWVNRSERRVLMSSALPAIGLRRRLPIAHCSRRRDVSRICSHL